MDFAILSKILSKHCVKFLTVYLGSFLILIEKTWPIMNNYVFCHRFHVPFFRQKFKTCMCCHFELFLSDVLRQNSWSLSPFYLLSDNLIFTHFLKNLILCVHWTSIIKDSCAYLLNWIETMKNHKQVNPDFCNILLSPIKFF